MAMQVNTNDNEMISTINIIPFVDIVLVLLIIFMVTSTAIVKAAIKVDLPTAAAAGSQVESTVNLVVTAQMQLMLDGDELSGEQAQAMIRKLVEKNPNLQAVISADKSLKYGDVVSIIDMVKSSGVSTFALNIERER